MDYGVIHEASIDYEAEESMKREALLRTALIEEILPFLALARSAEEYGHRKALAWDTLGAIADRHEVSYDDVENVADRMYGLIAQSRLKPVIAVAPCSNCDHASVDHAEGLKCSCGCSDYAPASDSKEARRTTAAEGDGPF